ncbi:MAG: radical SAM family heme chaperone HemW [Candidatus Cloacimonetes bacterium]|nr:radical SAM family heme chaperone HemW [Candidatus Cloacimonadota bacterium]
MGPHFPLGEIALGLYIHIPWCISRCNYCVFYSLAFSRRGFEQYYNSLKQEKELYLPYFDRPLKSVYFGGGTPSLLSASQINGLLKGLPLAEACEITLEINPIQISPAFIQELKQSPVNRLSLGIQSFDNNELKLLSRKHRAEDIPAKVKLLLDAGYSNLSGDLLYGIPGAKRQQNRDNLLRILDLGVPHLSCYLLEIEDNSPLAALRDKVPADEELAEMYEDIRLLSHQAGLKQYEISNFDRAGHASQHNLLYWHLQDYLALGASASGRYQSALYQNPASLESYSANVQKGVVFPESDAGEHLETDYIMMRLRLRAGLDFAEYEARFGKRFGRQQQLDKLQSLGLIELDGKGFRLAEKALFISNSVIAELL